LMAIRVFQINYDANRFQWLFVDSGDDDVRRGVRLDGSPRLAAWSPPPVYVEFPNLEKPDIWWLNDAFSMVLSSKAEAVLGEVLLEAELLPLPVGDEMLSLVNVVEVRNYLDYEKTQWFPEAEGLLAEVPEFAAHRIGGASLFKLPHDNVWLYCWEDDDYVSESFRHVVTSEGLTGLTFEEIWNSEDGGSRPSSIPGL
jgi:hypothetical protein